MLRPDSSNLAALPAVTCNTLLIQSRKTGRFECGVGVGRDWAATPNPTHPLLQPARTLREPDWKDRKNSRGDIE